MEEKAKTVLVIEDDHDIRVTLRDVFEGADFTVLSAANGLQAFELLKQIRPPHLIITDLNMPLMNGETFVKKKKEDQKIKDVPVIIISAHEQKFCKFPDVTCLPKPLDLSKLVKTANNAINSYPKSF